MEYGAMISECERYRYGLWRDWPDLLNMEKRRVCWVMLNPSTADAEEDDPTIRRCIGFAKSWGYTGIIVVNLFAFRATRPADLLHLTQAEGIGPENDATIREAVTSSLTGLVVCAWGTNAPLDREREVLRIIRSEGVVPHAVHLTASGTPGHPLYVSRANKPIALNREGMS